MLLKMIKHSVEEKEEMNMPIIESNRADNDLLVKYDDDDDDFDLDDEWKELANCHSDIDTEDEMIEDKIDDETDDKIEDMIQKEQKDMTEDNKERTKHLDMKEC